ncbi:transglutaminase-like cysteine peptidase [Sphingomonas kyungheensis]|uniref:Transglutaminase-like cysteine peptidase n=1 Tax=Sphingomonas kyungheensis TaxID=1069987 RepID=A0ABU8H4F2_9SPHN
MTVLALLRRLLLALALVSPALAAAHPVLSFITLDQPITAPRGFTAMCATRPELCSTVPMTGSATLTDDLRLIDTVNRTVNRRVRQQTDVRTYGRGELWTPAGRGRDARGDCEDIALEKRIELIQAGVPPETLFLAVGYARRIGLHVVLVARTGSGDLVLDSRTEGLRPWRDVPYQWIGAQSGQDPSRWFGIARS